MGRKEELIASYKSRIKPGKKSIAELQSWLKEKVDLCEISMSDFTEGFQRMTEYSAVHAAANQALNLDAHDMKFIAYRLKKTDKNSEYNDVLSDTNEEFVYVIFENNIDFLSCNSSKLSSEIIIERGVSTFDYENETVALLELIACMEQLNDGEY